MSMAAELYIYETVMDLRLLLRFTATA